MPQQQHHERFQLGERLQISWPTIAVFAGVLAFADAFWMVTLRGAVGAIEHTQEPFALWLRESLLLVPVYAGAMVVALLAARQWLARGRRPRLVVALAAVVVATTVTGVAAAGGTAMIDYRAQARQLGLLHTFHSPTTPQAGNGATSVTSAVPAASPLASCDALCRARKETVAAHVRGVRLASMVLLATNLVLSLWMLALRGGRLWRLPRRPTTTSTVVRDATEPALA